ncbi:hypothetical protein [Halobaculum sp. EA56]|uniref:hypothetical protein n=1 Tax=Halobaculum sp. EA56 TaxID=3421648 RepID=UPI003EBB343E
MYETRLGTDWEDIPEEEAIRRAYALGVAASFGYENREEFERLQDALDTSYDRSIVDLAYQEGKQEAAVVREDGETDTDEEVWDQLVTGVDPNADPGDADAGSAAGEPIAATGLPAALERAGLLDGGADLDALGFPALLGASPTDPGGAEGDG